MITLYYFLHVTLLLSQNKKFETCNSSTQNDYTDNGCCPSLALPPYPTLLQWGQTWSYYRTHSLCILGTKSNLRHSQLYMLGTLIILLSAFVCIPPQHSGKCCLENECWKIIKVPVFVDFSS